MIAFTRETAASRITFGPGRLEAIDEEVCRLGAERVPLISTDSAAAAKAQAAAALGSLVAGRWSEVRSHVTSELADRAGREGSWLGCDLIISVGDGPPPARPRPWPCAWTCRSSRCRPPTPASR